MVAAIGIWLVGCVEENVLPACRVRGDSQQQPWEAGVATQVDCIFGGARLVLSLDLQGGNPRSGLHSLCLAMALLKALFWKLGLSPG